MKTDKFIGEWNVHLLEPGDRLHFKKSAYHRDDEDAPDEFDITVHGTFLTSRHGPRIYSVEKIGPDECDDWYLYDDWIITIIDKEKSDDKSKSN